MLGEYLNANQLAEALGVTRGCIMNWQRKGNFPKGMKIGRVRRWNAESVREWLKTQEQH